MTDTPTIKYKQLLLKTLLGFLLVVMALPMMAQQAKTYDEAIILADKQFEKQYYLDAKAYYQMALRFKPKDEYATAQIGVIVQKMRENIALEEAYYEIIDLADVLYEEKAFDKALEQYKKALEVLPDDEYARKQMDSILKSKAEDQEKNEAFSRALEGGKRFMVTQQYDQAIASFEMALTLYPSHQIVTDLMEQSRLLQVEYNSKKKAFDEQVEQAERYVLVKDYSGALSHYEKASDLFPDDIYVNDKIAEYTPLAVKQKTYQIKLGAADELYMEKDFNGAREKYQEASALWPEDPYPSDMISRIEEQLALQRQDLDKNYQRSLTAADSLLELQAYTQAKGEYNLALTLKPGSSYPEEKIREIEAHFAAERMAQESEYQDIVTFGDSLFQARDYDLASSTYQQALAIRPDDAYPAEQLVKIDEQLAILAAALKKDKQYNALITEADQLMSSKQYESAIIKYNEAQTLKPEETYAAAQIVAIQEMIANAEKQAAIDKAYDQQLLLAQRFLQDDKLDQSKSAYEEALTIKPFEVEPKNQIAYIDSLQLDRIQKAEIDRKYVAFVKKGDSLQQLEIYAEAIVAFEAASEIKPNEAEAKQKIAGVKAIQDQIAAAEAAQKAYDKAIREGDQYFTDKSYELAKTSYQDAKRAKPEESYPVERIAAIDVLLEQLAAERQQRYTEAIAKADAFFDVNKHQEALLEYKIALSIKPKESHPQQRIEACNVVLAEKMRKIKGEYDLAVIEADKLYAAKVFDKAIKGYQKAETIKPDETYPSEMIGTITRYIEENAITDIIDTALIINSGVTERFDFDPIPIKVRKSNYVLVQARSTDGSPFKIIFTYGSEKGKNGGFVVQVPEEEDFNDFIIRVGNQYKWFSEDNNWISIYPENGNIEIKLVRISKIQ